MVVVAVVVVVVGVVLLLLMLLLPSMLMLLAGSYSSSSSGRAFSNRSRCCVEMAYLRRLRSPRTPPCSRSLLFAKPQAPSPWRRSLLPQSICIHDTGPSNPTCYMCMYMCPTRTTHPYGITLALGPSPPLRTCVLQA